MPDGPVFQNLFLPLSLLSSSPDVSKSSSSSCCPDATLETEKRKTRNTSALARSIIDRGAPLFSRGGAVVISLAIAFVFGVFVRCARLFNEEEFKSSLVGKKRRKNGK